MAKNLDSKCKKCRRIGEKLFLKGERCNSSKCSMVKRNYPPGFHGPKGYQRKSDYGLQLNEKQKAKHQYNLLEKQFNLMFEKASKKKGNTSEIFIKLLETRLDNIIYRVGLADSRVQARQLINHGHFIVNDKRINIPSFQVKTGNQIKVKNSKKNLKYYKNVIPKIQNKEVPGWLDFDKNNLNIKVLSEPDLKAIKTNFNIQAIVEFYSR